MGSTPANCKKNQTVLLCKKDDPREFKNCRPFALADTLTRFYTGLLTDFAEHHNILSSSQEGFRQEKGTSRQLLMMQNTMHDAKLLGTDIFLMYRNFSSGFNTIHHDKLLKIMYDLGFPVGCIEAVRDLYSDVETKFKLPFGNTKPIQIQRGTVQGDSLCSACL